MCPIARIAWVSAILFVLPAAANADDRADLVAAQSSLDRTRDKLRNQLGATKYQEYTVVRDQLNTLRPMRDLLRVQPHFSQKTRVVVTRAELEQKRRNIERQLAETADFFKPSVQTELDEVNQTIKDFAIARLDPQAKALSGSEFKTYDELDREVKRLEEESRKLTSGADAVLVELDKAEAVRDRSQAVVDNSWVLHRVVLLPETGMEDHGTYKTLVRPNRRYSVSQSSLVVRYEDARLNATVQHTVPPRILKPGSELPYTLTGQFEGKVPDGIPGPGIEARVAYVMAALSNGKPGTYREWPVTLTEKDKRIAIGVNKDKRSDSSTGVLMVPSNKGMVWQVLVMNNVTDCRAVFEYYRASDLPK